MSVRRDCWDPRKNAQHVFSKTMLERVYENARIIPFLNCPLCGRSRPMFVKQRDKHHPQRRDVPVVPKVPGVHQPGVRRVALDDTLAQKMVRWNHFDPKKDELFVARVQMPRIKLEDIHDPEILRRISGSTKGRSYWCGGFQYFSGMTLSQISELLEGPESEHFQACASEWFSELDQEQVTAAMGVQMAAIADQLNRLQPAFEKL